jgi:hypothetical protein
LCGVGAGFINVYLVIGHGCRPHQHHTHHSDISQLLHDGRKLGVFFVSFFVSVSFSTAATANPPILTLVAPPELALLY